MVVDKGPPRGRPGLSRSTRQKFSEVTDDAADHLDGLRVYVVRAGGAVPASPQVKAREMIEMFRNGVAAEAGSVRAQEHHAKPLTFHERVSGRERPACQVGIATRQVVEQQEK
jgi:hypothetical protein